MKLALINGNIHTLDTNNNTVQALAIDDHLITRTGSNQQIQELDKTYDQIIDLQNQTVLPGFIDGHTHLGQIALESLWVDLSQTKTKNQLLELIKSRIDTTRPGNWVVGVNYDDAPWVKSDVLTKVDIDNISMDHPIFIRRICGHYAVANSAALERIDRSWKYVDRNTGVLLEDVVLGFMKIIKPDLEIRIQGTNKMLKKVHSLGITAAREIVNYQSVKVYKSLDEKNELDLRIFGYLSNYDIDDYLHDYPDGKLSGANFNVIGLKILLDGSLGARTAALKNPYTDDPENRGKLLYTNQELEDFFQIAKKLDLSLMVHAIGDRAIQQFIDTYISVFNDQVPDNPKSHTIEHVEVVDQSLIDEIKNLGIIISAQPNFAGRWSVPNGLNEQRLGISRLAMCNAYKSFIDNEIPMIFGSDCMPLDPIFGIKSAIQHPIKDQRITPFESVRAYTQTCYGILGKESIFGSIEQGKIADLVVLNKNPMDLRSFNNDDLEVTGTIFNGELVYSNGLKIL